MALDRKIAYINLTTGDIEVKPIPMEVRKKFLGGRGLDAYLLYNHTEKGCDPLGPDNALIISGGILCATLASATARTHVMAKSPLTGLLGSCNMGGFFAPEMAWAGFHHLVIKGKAEKPCYIYINNGEIEIRDAANIWGKTVTDTQWAIHDELNDKEVKSLVIGPAGENLVAYANVMTGVKNAGGRTGMGAVMGSKNLKAVSCRGTMDVKITHPMEALEYNKKFIEQITGAKVNQTQGTLGTPFIWGATNSWGGVRTENFRYNQLEYADDIEPERIDEIATETMGPYHMAGCFGCQVHCRAQYKIPSGKYKGKYDEGPEYTSQGAFGAEVGCRSAETVLAGNHLVDQFGMDNLETGSMIAWAMECFEEGLITKEQTDGIDLSFGNDEAVLEMIERICYRKGWLGDVLAKGGIPASKNVGKDSFDYLIQVKGMANLHSDERGTPALALNIATSSRGSDHLRSRPAIDLYHLPEKVLRKIYSTPVPYDGPLSSEHTEYVGKPWQVFWQENCYMAVDSLGICKYHTTFLGATLPNFENWPKVLYLNTGIEMTPEEIWEVARRNNMIERLFNLREGATRNDPEKGDVLNHRYHDEPCKRGAIDVIGKYIVKDKFDAMVDEFYEHKGLDKNGIPKKSTLKELGLENEPSHLV
ncbi:MAG: aldehyde ferredoxin oxidoreductase family protein [Desulfobacula sp.]|jgi:aldehyde:ferredoxin oxidoreductase|uniref:aldehyde ferredoxin oxidoreductase family protein n=1 Tax=Desulfobacula sp. TaxID=2593537 RepID=UPI001DCD938F|nr:aldehyde ferredoxin oxidoreductase family protein [Desulfobacula sp.]MBT3485948.1 aldehyde ferredoxin oxidoreductase family protein [Desulfobacula sp.]MBT3805174.1 aldehyde ferredoxin oxidoreductase family protein [Desulfobacula sp.]MBT4025521.1 aldehyde ferredoxin oxidoreductase family protein [Desulfobacula sp.]MBT4198920.1 aldehyde ferredoxin oxidoreductase family protein [Desulfobacula sp.]